jgi:O-antigen biosynthesis protein WbqP
MRRLFDIVLAILLIVFTILPMLIIAIAVIISSKGPAIYWSNRIGKNKKIFKMPKFRSMKTNAPNVATHLLSDVDKLIPPFGRFLRKYSLDELPQLYSILKGDMSFIGPRPALFNQYDLIDLRESKGINNLKPGLTGWAQVNGRDDLTIFKKVEFEVEYINNKSFLLDLKIIWMTFSKVIGKNGVSH